VGSHNTSAVLLRGHGIDAASRAIEHCPLLGKTTRGILYWVLRAQYDQISVKQLRSAFGLGDKAWVTQREKLREMHVLTQKRTLLEDGSSHWSLTFDFEPLFAFLPDLQKGGDHARASRARDPREIVGSRAHARSPQKGGDHACGVNKKIQGTPNTAPPLGGMGSGGPGATEGKLMDHPWRGDQQANSISKNIQAKKFFNFLSENGIELVKIEALLRKADGSRGAPVGNIFLEKNFQKTNSAIYHFDNFARILLMNGKKKFDFQTASIELDGDQSKVIFLDDLKEDSLEKLLQQWSGAIVILETSSKNYQAILIMDLPRIRSQRVEIQKAISSTFFGDSAAVSSIQLHRFPGSINWGKGAFVCQLYETRKATGKSNENNFFTKQKSAVFLPKMNPKLPKYQAQSDSKINSEMAFGMAIQMLREGRSREEIVEFLSQPQWLRHHTQDWPERTWRAAMDKFRPAVGRLH